MVGWNHTCNLVHKPRQAGRQAADAGKTSEGAPWDRGNHGGRQDEPSAWGYDSEGIWGRKKKEGKSGVLLDLATLFAR